MSTADCVSSPCFFLFKTDAKRDRLSTRLTMWPILLV